MIVEDNELNMKLFHDLLEAHGYRTVSTRDGFKVPDLARKHRPDLILMDIQLPEVSGLEVTNWLKEDPELQAIPVVAVTAFAMKGDEERIREGGCEAYLSKPISVPKFIETVRRFLGVGLSIPAVSQPAAVGAAAPSPQQRRAPRRRPAQNHRDSRPVGSSAAAPAPRAATPNSVMNSRRLTRSPRRRPRAGRAARSGQAPSQF